MMFPKPPAVFVSPELRAFAKGQDCTLMLDNCQNDISTTVLCHVRKNNMAGVAQKPHDFFGYHGCADCHRMEGQATSHDLLRAMMKTQDRVYAALYRGELKLNIKGDE